MRIATRVVLAGLLVPSVLGAQTTVDSAKVPEPAKVEVSGFVDSYYAYDFGRPPSIDRVFTTQAVRHNEFNINLAFLAVSVQREKIRGRLALQFGTSVQANYAGEPTTGTNSGPDISRYLQEATIGVRLAPTVWVDGGIYFSYIGLEGWISRDNPTYTRSLVAEYTPYYLTGAKLSWQVTPKLAAQFHFVNGWQIISENNGSKSVGMRLDYSVTPTTVLSYANYVGNEQPSGQPARLRVYNQVMAKTSLGERFDVQGQVDYGRQDNGAGTSEWYGGVLIGRAKLSPRIAVVGRVERYSDPDQVIVLTSTPGGFNVNGASIGVDAVLPGGVLWRNEFRGFRGAEAYYPSEGVDAQSRNSATVVTSLSFTF